MKRLLDKYKSVSKPIQIFIGILGVLFIIGIARGGFIFGVWLKTMM